MAVSYDTPQTPGFAKLLGRGIMPAKQIAHEMLPGPHARATITKGDPVQRSLGNYGKMTPADANGLGQIGVNINSMARNTPS
jgi:hypothetical protein